MLNKNTKIALLALVCIVLIVVVMKGWKSKKIKDEQANNTSNTEKSVSYEQDPTTGEYIIYDNNGQEITRVMDEAEVKIYQDNPDYDPKLPAGDYSDSYTDGTETSDMGVY